MSLRFHLSPVYAVLTYILNQYKCHDKSEKQAGAELCQPQVKLGLIKLDLLVIKVHLPCVKNLRLISIYKKIEDLFFLHFFSVLEVVFSLQKNAFHLIFFSSSFISKKNEVNLIWLLRFKFGVEFEPIPGGWLAGKDTKTSSLQPKLELGLSYAKLI